MQHGRWLVTVVRWALLRVVRQVAGDDTGAPSRGVVILCMLLTLVSAWVTDFIGIDAIFGAFVAGIIVPREHRWVVLCGGGGGGGVFWGRL